jgi:tetratricopeptide (TPR) repeat protein
VHLLAARAHILARLGHIEEARAAAEAEADLADRLGRPELQATATHDVGMVAFVAEDFKRAEQLLAAALDADAPVSRARVRLTRAEALVRLGRLDEAEAELRATTLEPVTPSDFPHTLVPRLTRVQGLVAAARGNRQLAVHRLNEAADSWRHHTRPSLEGDDYVANLADLGRPPVEGLIEPAREYQQVLADLELLHANAGAE